MAIYFRAADRREVPASEALDARGILRHGYGQRVPHTMRDAAPRLTARSFWDQGNLRVTDARAIGGVEGCRPGYRVLDSDLGRQAIADARAAYIFDLENSWRSPPRDAAFGAPPYGAYPLSAGEGTACTVDGRPGRLVREGNVLVCQPLAADARTVDARDCPDCDGDGDGDGEDDDGETCATCRGSGQLPGDDNGETTSDRRMLDVDAVSAAHQKSMAKIYQQIADDVSQRWRER